MGNSVSEITSRVEGLNIDAVSKFLNSDLEILGDPGMIFNTGKLLSRTDLEEYQIPGFDKTKHKEEDASTEQEEAMFLSLGNMDKLKDKHGDAIGNLIEDIIRKRGEDVASKEIIVKLQGLSRMFEGLLRVDKFRKLKASSQINKEEAKSTISPTANVAIKMGLSTILLLVEFVGDIKPELYQRVIRQSSDILSGIPPLSLQSTEPTISESMTLIAEFFDNVLKGDNPKLDKLSSLKPLLAMCIATGNLNSILVLTLRVLHLEKTDKFRPVLEQIYPHLRTFKDLGTLAAPFHFEKVGTGIVLSDGGTAISCETAA